MIGIKDPITLAALATELRRTGLHVKTSDSRLLVFHDDWFEVVVLEDEKHVPRRRAMAIANKAGCIISNLFKQPAERALKTQT